MRAEDRDSFTAFVHEWSPPLMRVAFLLTGDRGLAEDLLQSSLEKVSRRWRHLDDQQMAYGYVRRVMVNTHISWRRRRAVTEVLVDTWPDLPEEDAPRPARAGQALAALAHLPPRMRTTVVLRFYEGLTEAETAQAMGSSLGSVKSQASRGLARLRDHLEPTTSAALPHRHVTTPQEGTP